MGKGGQSDFDLVVVADLLPMLSLREFVEAAQDFQPHAEIVVTGEVTTAPELRLDGYSFCPKPLCIQDLVNFVRGKRRDLFKRPICFVRGMASRPARRNRVGTRYSLSTPTCKAVSDRNWPRDFCRWLRVLAACISA